MIRASEPSSATMGRAATAVDQRREPFAQPLLHSFALRRTLGEPVDACALTGSMLVALAQICVDADGQRQQLVAHPGQQIETRPLLQAGLHPLDADTEIVGNLGQLVPPLVIRRRNRVDAVAQLAEALGQAIGESLEPFGQLGDRSVLGPCSKVVIDTIEPDPEVPRDTVDPRN